MNITMMGKQPDLRIISLLSPDMRVKYNKVKRLSSMLYGKPLTNTQIFCYALNILESKLEQELKLSKDLSWEYDVHTAGEEGDVDAGKGFSA